MLVVLYEYKDRNNSNNNSVATMKDYYSGTADKQKEWNDTYMDIHLLQQIIMTCLNRDVQKNLDKGVQFGNTSYPGELEKSTGLVLQYDKEKERELLHRKKYNNNKYNNNNNNKNNTNNNNNNNNKNHNGYDGSGVDKTDTVGVILDENKKKKRMEHVLALVNAR